MTQTTWAEGGESNHIQVPDRQAIFDIIKVYRDELTNHALLIHTSINSPPPLSIAGGLRTL